MVQKAFVGLLVSLLLLCIMAHGAWATPSNPTHRKNKKKSHENDQKDLAKLWEEDHKTIPDIDDPWLIESETRDFKTDYGDYSLEQREDITESKDLEKDYAKKKHPEDEPKNCSVCAINEQRRALRLEGIKNQILSQLGLSRPPNITGNYLPRSPVIKDLLGNYNIQSDQPAFKPGPEYGDDDEFHIATEKVISLSQSPPKSYPVFEDGKVMFFKISGNVLGEHIHSAELHVYFKPNPLITERNISLYRLSRHISHGHQEPKQIAKHSIENKSDKGFWIRLDIKRTVIHWFKHPKDNIILLLRTSSPDLNELVVDFNDENADNAKPFILIEVKKQVHRRIKRMIGLNCQENSTEVRCCRYPLTVDFEKFGWKWVIAPKRYEANYCSGECPYVFLQRYPHTHLVQQANPNGSAGPCCAPRKMSPISMLYFDEDHNIIYGLLPGMVVDRCGCS